MVCDLEHIVPFSFQFVILWKPENLHSLWFITVTTNLRPIQTIDSQEMNVLHCHQRSAWTWGNGRGCDWSLIKPRVVRVPLFLCKKQWHTENQQIFLCSLPPIISLFLWPIALIFFIPFIFIYIITSRELICDSSVC